MQERCKPGITALHGICQRDLFTFMHYVHVVQDLHDEHFLIQNNNRGGYNAGDSLTSNRGFTTEEQIYRMVRLAYATSACIRIRRNGEGGAEDTPREASVSPTIVKLHPHFCSCATQYTPKDV